MSKPDHSPEGGNPRPKEGEPTHSGFRIRVEKPELIYKAFQEGAVGEMGSVILEYPIREVKLEAVESDEGTFNLRASFSIGTILDSDDRYPHPYKLKSGFSSQFKEVKERVVIIL